MNFEERTSQIRKINIGAGRKVLKGWDNLDVHDRFGANIICDLRKLPINIEDNYYDVVLAEHVLEHMPDALEMMDEFLRILKPKGRLIVEVPYGDYVWDTIDHRRQFYITTFIGYPHQFDTDHEREAKFLRAKFKTGQKSPWIKFKVFVYNQLIKLHPKAIDYTFLRFFSKGLFLRVEFEKKV